MKLKEARKAWYGSTVGLEAGRERMSIFLKVSIFYCESEVSWNANLQGCGICSLLRVGKSSTWAGTVGFSTQSKVPVQGSEGRDGHLLLVFSRQMRIIRGQGKWGALVKFLSLISQVSMEKMKAGRFKGTALKALDLIGLGVELSPVLMEQVLFLSAGLGA